MTDREDELRRHLQDPRWALSEWEEAEEVIRLAAIRSRKFSVKAVTTMLVLLAGIAGLGIGLSGQSRQLNVVAPNPANSLPGVSATGVASASSSPSPQSTSSPSSGQSSARTSDAPVLVVAASFINARNGWVLGSLPSCVSCATVRQTGDGGQHWSSVPFPQVELSPLAPSGGGPTAVSDLLFSDSIHGFAFGPGLWTSNDAAQTWQKATLQNVQQLVVANGHAYAITSSGASGTSFELWRETIGSSYWSRLPQPVQAAPVLIAAAGDNIFLLREGSPGPLEPTGDKGQLFTSTSLGQSWVQVITPCGSTDGGAAALAIAVGPPSTTLVDCFSNLQSQQQQHTQHHLYESMDGAHSWIRLGDPAVTGVPAVLADNGKRNVVFGVSGDINLLSGSFDGGMTWSTLAPQSNNFHGWQDLNFIDANTGFIVGPQTGGNLYQTVDGGRSWHAVPV